MTTVLSFLLSFSQVFAADACGAIFRDLEARLQSQKDNAQQVSRFLMTELTKESDALKAEFKAKKEIDLDLVCLGAGAQCAAASLAVGRTAVRGVVVEKSELVARTFAEKDFFINSSEASKLSMHAFPGGFGTPADLTSRKYAHSGQLAAHLQAQQYVSRVPVLLGTTVTSIRTIERKGQTLVEAQTDQGFLLRAKTLVLGSGLGDVATKVRDENYQTAFAKAYQDHLEQPAKILPVMSTDTFLIALKHNADRKVVPVLPKDIVLIGNGDGSRIALEGIHDVNPDGAMRVSWIGNPAKNAKEYMATRVLGDRYVMRIVPQYASGRIKGVAGHVGKVESLPGGRFRVTVTDAETKQTQAIETDMIIDSTGYENVNTKLLLSVVGAVKPADVTGPLKDLNLVSTVLSRQFVDAKGRRLPIYALGASAGPLATEAELAGTPNLNPMSIFNTVGRTSQFISQLLGVPSLPGTGGGVRESRPPVRAASELIEALKARRAQ